MTSKVWIHFCLCALLLQPSLQEEANFRCDDGLRGVRGSNFCDGVDDCADASDELLASPANLRRRGHKLVCESTTVANRTCLVARSQLCSGAVRCRNLTPCHLRCPGFYACVDGRTCVARTTIGDGDACNGCPEDGEWDTGAGFKCVRNGRRRVLPQQLVRDRVKDCDGGEDACFVFHGTEMRLDPEKCFRCLRQSDVIVPVSKVCDAEIDCPDLSDECMCVGHEPELCRHIPTLADDGNSPHQSSSFHKRCDPGTLECGDGTCVELSSVCDGTKDCENARDESFALCRGTLRCVDGTNSQANEVCRCERNCTVATGVLCDGVGDCPPPEGDKWTREPGYPDDECVATCGAGKFNCTRNPPAFRFDDWNAPRFLECWQEYAETYYEPAAVHVYSVPESRWCDGKVDCAPFGDDETRARCPHRFHCAALGCVNIARSKVCDGRRDCDDGEDEVACVARHYCPVLDSTKISIDRRHVCDLHVNCDDASDELNCSQHDRFYCESGKPLFVSIRQKLDGRIDCEDWSDECPSGDRDLFSSRDQLVADPLLRAIVWCMALLAIAGNLSVIYNEYRIVTRLFAKSDASASLRANHLLVLNLAVADLLMGIYLAMLGVVIATHSGTYCKHKVDWLTGRTCSWMGMLVVVSSETSVCTMLMLTALRLSAVHNPFNAATALTTTKLAAVVMATWTVAIGVALIPQLPSTQHVFRTKAVLRANPFFRRSVVELATFRTFALRFATFGARNVTEGRRVVESVGAAASWDELGAAMTKLTPSDTAGMWTTAKTFGYYSCSSVCIPNLFVTRDVTTWRFSVAMTSFNFAAFVAVAISYAYIYAKSRRAAPALRQLAAKRCRKKTKVLQRRVLRLVATDFCCWIPVSILTFVNLAGVALPEVTYAVAAVLLLPINSALNPLLYSAALDRFLARACAHVKRVATTGSDRKSSTRSTVVVFVSKSSARLKCCDDDVIGGGGGGKKEIEFSTIAAAVKSG